MYSLSKDIKKIVAIIGGMGPSAGLTLHQKLINNNETAKKDQDHIPILHTSFSSIITDRTDYIFGKDIQNPMIGALKCISVIENSLIDSNIKEVIVGIPCNTFHTYPILNPFLFYLNNIPICNFKFSNMVDLTGKFIKKNYQNEKVGLFSTIGTNTSNLYLDEAKKNNFELVYLSQKKNLKIDNIIYNKDWGIKKKNNPVDDKAIEIFNDCVNEYKKIGVNNIILGCSELPLIHNNSDIDDSINFIDPVDILSKQMILDYYDDNNDNHDGQLNFYL